MLNKLILGAAALALATSPAFAHLDPVEHGSLVAGMSHPLFGLDHVLAMVAVGLWAVMLGGRSVWLVPAAFVGTMLVGFALAVLGAPLPFVESTIMASVVVLGLLLAAAVKVPAWAGMSLVGAFALFHGFAHGGEMGAAGALEFGVGFILATAALHAVGIAAGLAASRLLGGAPLAIRAAGALTAAAGILLAVQG